MVTEGGLGRAFAREEIAAMADTIRQWRADAALLAKFGAAAATFGRDHTGPARAVAAWEKRLAPVE